jgi:hypothetical protein
MIKDTIRLLPCRVVLQSVVWALLTDRGHETLISRVSLLPGPRVGEELTFGLIGARRVITAYYGSYVPGGGSCAGHGRPTCAHGFLL